MSDAVKAELLLPSALGPAELDVWHAFMKAEPDLTRAFLSPEFALACEQAFGRVEVAIFHQAGEILGFFPFQFESGAKAVLRSAVRIGGELCDNAGLIARPGFVIPPTRLLKLCRLSALYVTHLTQSQTARGLQAEDAEVGHLIDLSEGSAAYFTELSLREQEFVGDTRRRQRRASEALGEMRFETLKAASAGDALTIIERKRRQYARTKTKDPFGQPGNTQLIEALIATASKQCQPIIHRLSAEQGVIAQHLGLGCGSCLNYWFPVYDPAVGSFAPGRLLLWSILENAEMAGIRLIDRGAGDTPAKRSFSNAQQMLGRALWTTGRPNSYLPRVLRSLRWRLDRPKG
jgi:CelD/BcsL family acetyltransferase involved in cellulose biosynthesis